MVHIKRAYEPPSRGDGTRILVDRLWPRGLKKEQVKVVKWMKELGPSTELRKSFGHDPADWKEFRKRYKVELRRPEARVRHGDPRIQRKGRGAQSGGRHKRSLGLALKRTVSKICHNVRR